MSADVFNPMPAHDTPDPSYVTGPIQADVSRVVSKGAAPNAHPELADGHRDVRLAHVADLSDEASFGHGADRHVMGDRVGSGAFIPSSKLKRGHHE